MRYRIAKKQYYNLGNVEITKFDVEQRHKFLWIEWWEVVTKYGQSNYAGVEIVELSFPTEEEAAKAINNLLNDRPVQGWDLEVIKEYTNDDV